MSGDLPGRPGLQVLAQAESLQMEVQWRVEKSTG